MKYIDIKPLIKKYLYKEFEVKVEKEIENKIVKNLISKVKIYDNGMIIEWGKSFYTIDYRKYNHGDNYYTRNDLNYIFSTCVEAYTGSDEEKIKVTIDNEYSFYLDDRELRVKGGKDVKSR